MGLRLCDCRYRDSDRVVSTASCCGREDVRTVTSEFIRAGCKQQGRSDAQQKMFYEGISQRNCHKLATRPVIISSEIGESCEACNHNRCLLCDFSHFGQSMA